MADEPYDGGLVTPFLGSDGRFFHFVHGMTQRTWLAGAAMMSGQCPHDPTEHNKRAKWAFKEADAMLNERGLPTRQDQEMY
jgi:hypothetical protein